MIIDKKNVYWLNPKLLYFIWILLVIYTYNISNKNIETLFDTLNYVTIGNVFVYIIFFIVFCLGCNFASRSEYNTYDIDEYKELKTYKLLFIIYLLSNFVWYINIYMTYGASIVLGLLGNLTGYYEMFKDDGGRISGITTFTEIGIVTAPYGMYLFKKTKNKKIYLSLIIILCLNTIRSFIFAERIAILEVLLPMLIIWLSFYNGKYNKSFKFVPIFSILFLFVFFGIFEYFRSWMYYRNVYDGTFIQFVIDRVIIGYYSISINNECLFLNKSVCCYFPSRILEWLWMLPGFSGFSENFTSKMNYDLLADYANPEFNNIGGLLACYSDLGFLGVVPQFIFGYYVYKSYIGYLNGHYLYSLVFSISVYAILELPRYFFWGSKRAFFVFVGLFIIRFLVLKKITYENCS